MSKPETPWIVAHDGRGKKPFGLECERCGCFEKTELPMEVGEFVKVGREFAKKHESCPEAPQ
jgi:hypothetical protein